MSGDAGSVFHEAERVQREAARLGFDWPDIAGPLDKLREEVEELSHAIAANDHEAIEDEFGDLLFSVVNAARHAEVDCNAALDRATKKFSKRWNAVRDHVKVARGSIANMTLSELDAEWEAVKRNGLREREKEG